MAIIKVDPRSRVKEHTITITTDLLIPGRGKPQKDMAVTIKDAKIADVCAIKDLPVTTPSQTTHVPVLLPGLWDCHLHYIGLKDVRIDDIVKTPQALSGARCAADAHKTLRSGFTSCRDLMGYGVQIAQAINDGIIPGPRIYSAVAALSQTAGHADAHSVDPSVVQDFCKHGGPMCIADGLDECRKAVRTQIRRGATLIKVMATGGVLSVIDDPQDAQFSSEELSVIVEEAAKTGRIVAAHCHGKAGIMAALNAGCKTIEHGSYLDEECITLMKKKGAMLVATSTVVKEGVKHAELMDRGSFEKMKVTEKVHDGAYKLAVKSGVKCALGTDLAVSSPEYSGLAHGNGGQELFWACDAGMSPLEAIECATANGPATLGERYAPLSGQIKRCFDADLIAMNESPLDDIELFSNPDNITHVWKGGELVKSPGK